ncbi:MAG: DNA topoisomerase [Eubacteriales bacterium]|nr:DNA topoisomerase [Eubacteriales bacterium]
MGKSVFIAEKPSVAREFAGALSLQFRARDGYLEAENTIVTWCVGHLVTMSYPDAYDAKYKRWSLSTIPFIPEQYRYQVIDGVKKQFAIVKSILTDKAVETIYICTDSGREGEYIYRLVAMEAGVRGKKQRRVWIDSQTKEEIIRGIKEAKDDAAYDCLGAAAFLRAKEDYLMGINFSRALTLKYGDSIRDFLRKDRCVIAVGRVMTCVLGMVVEREREIRSFVKTPFYRVLARLSLPTANTEAATGGLPVIPIAASDSVSAHTSAAAGSFSVTEQPQGTAVPTQPDLPGGAVFEAEWHVSETSVYAGTPALYKENGFKERKDAEALIAYLSEGEEAERRPRVVSVSRKKETKNPPLLYNLAELQNDCSRFFKISPDQTLAAAQELYEKKLTTYPRTDARVLSSAVAKEISRNIKGLAAQPMYAPYVREILAGKAISGIGKSRYTNDKAITDHYAIIPTGQGERALSSVSPTVAKVYELICRRFLAIFYPPAVYDRIALQIGIRTELFAASAKTCRERGYLEVMNYSFSRRKAQGTEENVGAERAESVSGNRVSGAEDPGTATGDDAEHIAGMAARDDATNSAGAATGDDAENSADAAGEPAAQEALLAALGKLRKGTALSLREYTVREGETSPPKRYNSGSMILTMENAGQFIEEEELREQIKGSGIGTSATRAEILKKLVANQYLALNKKTQIITPTQLGEMIYDTVACSLRPLLNPKLTASWEMGLSRVAEGSVTEEEYMAKLDDFVRRRTNHVKETDFRGQLHQLFCQSAAYYQKGAGKGAGKK